MRAQSSRISGLSPAQPAVAEGVVVEQGAVLSMGVFLGASTKIVDRSTGAQEKVESEGLEYRSVFGLEELGLGS